MAMAKTDVTAEMSGTVIEVSCAPGSVATEGHTLFILESMKMEMPLAAPCHGKVVDVMVQVGDVVNGGQIMAVLEHAA